MKVNDIIPSFLDENRLKVRATTMRYNIGHCKVLSEYFGELNIEDLTKHIILQYIQNCKELGHKNSTINKRITMLYRIMHYAVDNEYVDLTDEQEKNFKMIYKFGKLKDDTNSYRKLSDHQLHDLLQYIDNLPTNKFLSLRNKIILALMLSTGVRRNELINIKKDNVDMENNSIYLAVTKTGLTRYIYFDDSIKELLSLWFKRTAKINSEWVFISGQFHTKLTTNGIDELFRKLKKELKFGISPHVLRHTFATACVENDISLSILQQLMGHTRLSTTQIYIHMADRHIKQEAINHNPYSVRQ
jgi:site-specific recombinase XerD